MPRNPKNQKNPGSSKFSLSGNIFPPPGGGGFPPGGGGPGGPQMPPGPPPLSLTPSAPRRGYSSTYRVDPGSLRPCMFRYVYVWLRNGRSFWFYPVYVGRTSAAGYRWDGYTWRYYGLDLDRIVSFQCF